MFVLGVQHSDSIFLWNVLYLKVSQDKDYLSLCCILNCSSLFLLQIVVCVSYSPTPILPLPPPSLHWELLVLCTVSQFQCRRLAGDPGLIPGSGRTPGGGNGNPLQDSCLENPWMGSLVGYSPRGRTELDTTECLNSSSPCSKVYILA